MVVVLAGGKETTDEVVHTGQDVSWNAYTEKIPSRTPLHKSFDMQCHVLKDPSGGADNKKHSNELELRNRQWICAS